MSRNLNSRLEKLEAMAGSSKRERVILWRDEGKTADEVIDEHLGERPDHASRELMAVGWVS